jgi:hypothetical protein
MVRGDSGSRPGRQTELELARPEPSARRMSRTQLVDRILELNPTASPASLGEFDEDSLAHYLEHLCVANEPLVPWVRRGQSPGIVRREAGE